MKVMGAIRVAIVDDHRVVQTGLASYFGSFPDLQVVGAAASGEEALARLDAWAADVVVMDLTLPGGIDGIEATRRLCARAPATRVVVLTAHTDDVRGAAALDAGAIGYVRKDADPEVLLAAVRGAASGRTVLDPASREALLAHLRGGRREALTEREREVLRQLALGRTNREIAAAIGVSEETVKSHVGNILGKLQLGHRTQAVVLALKQGLLTLDEL
jgi:NarL family two-component system response regulator LiaR